MSQFLPQTIWFIDTNSILKEWRIVKRQSRINHVIQFASDDDEIVRDDAEFRLRVMPHDYFRSLNEAAAEIRRQNIPLRGIERLKWGGEPIDTRLYEEIMTCTKSNQTST